MTRFGMSVAAGALVAVGFALETLLPWASAVWRRRKAAKKAVGTPEKPSEAPMAASEVPMAASEVPMAASEVPMKAEPVAAPVEADRNSTVRPERDHSERDLSEHPVGEAQMLWEEARAMPHSTAPELSTDWNYMTRIHKAALLGHLKAMVKLGEYAGRRNALVEAYYWTLLASLNGARGLDPVLQDLKVRWMGEGAPEEYANVSGQFTEEQGVFARAVLRLQCGIDRQYARARLDELANRGLPEARLFLKVFGRWA